MKVLVLGGNGMLGPWVIKAMASRTLPAGLRSGRQRIISTRCHLRYRALQQESP